MATIIGKARLTSPRFDSKKYVKEVRTYMKEQQILAIKRWLKTVLKHTPTYTGTARGTYAPIGRVVGHAVRKGLVRGDRKQAAKKKYFKYGGISYPLGFAAGSNYQEHKITSRFQGGALTFKFTFDQRLPYVLWNEATPGPSWFHFKTPPPWHALERGNKSYYRYLEKIRKNFPKPKIKMILYTTQLNLGKT